MTKVSVNDLKRTLVILLFWKKKPSKHITQSSLQSTILNEYMFLCVNCVTNSRFEMTQWFNIRNC